ncbi:unnamed protein product [Nesidiocoris tenuis]|uniref:Uncharacterized protein n=1 Tax=Nesidiocoris tenuis TaxID=355587 RepID=A0A6H5G3M9_9HEMI|nr:unnamed protein product [Nesidiocoris tenuis]
MSESMNLDSNDIVGSLEGFESLEHIQAELGILDETSQGNQSDHVEVLELMRHPIVDKRRDGNVKNEIIMEDDMGDDDEMIASRLEESMSTHMMHSNVSDIMHNVMDMDEHEVENERMDQGSHDGHADDLDQRRLFSEGVIKNEIIVDSQVMTEGLGDDDNSIEAASIHNEQICRVEILKITAFLKGPIRTNNVTSDSLFQILTDSDVRYLDDIMNDGVNETVIEAAEVEDQTAEMECSFVTLPGLPSLDTSANTNEEIIVADQNPELATADRFLNQDVVKTEKIDDTPSSISLTSFAGTNLQPPPLTLVSKTDLQVQEAVKSITSGVYVVNSSTASTAIPSNLIQSGGTLLAPKDAGDCKITTVTPSIPGLKPAATVNGNRKIAPALPPLKAKETSPVEAPAAPADEALDTLEPMPLAQPVLEPPAQLPPVPAQLPPSPEPPKPLTVTSFAEEEPGTRAAPEADSLCRRSSSPPSSPSSTLMPRQEMKPADPRQEQWSGDESYVEANGIRPRKPCNCTKSMCLKL